jgi:hypothetical protein
MFNAISNLWCETWSSTLREEHRLRIFKNRDLRRIFGPKMDEATGGYRALYNEELIVHTPHTHIMRMRLKGK